MRVKGKNGARAKMKWFHDHGYGNAGATSGHLIPGHENLLKIGWKGVYARLLSLYNALDSKERQGAKRSATRAMLTASTMARDLALKYKELCLELVQREKNPLREDELSDNGTKSWQSSLGARNDILGSRAGAVDQPHAGDDR